MGLEFLPETGRPMPRVFEHLRDLMRPSYGRRKDSRAARLSPKTNQER
jgi:hypothetical protein